MFTRATRPTIVLFTLAGGLGLAAPARAADLHVPDQFPTIQIALNLASDGDTVVVAPGTYFEAIDFGGKAIEVRSTGGAALTTINALGRATSVVRIVADSISVPSAPCQRSHRPAKAICSPSAR